MWQYLCFNGSCVVSLYCVFDSRVVRTYLCFSLRCKHRYLSFFLYSQSFKSNISDNVVLHFLSPMNTSPLLLPLTVFVRDLAGGCTGSSGKQNKAIWFLRPCTAPTLQKQTGGNDPVPVPALLCPILCLLLVPVEQHCRSLT